METGAIGRGALALAGVLGLIGMGGCQTGMYDWGSYDASVLALYSPESVGNPDLGHQIQALQTEVNATEANAKPNEPSRVPPGKYAQLGYLYAMHGDREQARRCFESEKKIYPESTQFVDLLLRRMQ